MIIHPVGLCYSDRFLGEYFTYHKRMKKRIRDLNFGLVREVMM